MFNQVRELLAHPDLLAAGEAALVARAPTPDDELLAAQLTRLQRRLDAVEPERRRLADLYQAGVISETELARRAAELEARHRHLDQQRQALLDQHTALGEHNRLNRRIEAFAERALAGLDQLDFEDRQQLLRLVLEDVRVQGWHVELRLHLPLDENPPDKTAPPTSSTRTNRRRAPRGARPAKEAVSTGTVRGRG